MARVCVVSGDQPTQPAIQPTFPADNPTHIHTHTQAHAHIANERGFRNQRLCECSGRLFDDILWCVLFTAMCSIGLIVIVVVVIISDAEKTTDSKLCTASLGGGYGSNS